MIMTGEGGFLYNELYPHIKNLSDDVIILMGSPTFDGDISQEGACRLHDYVTETIDIIEKNKDRYIVFCSSTGVDDISFDHSGSTSYSISKLYLENYILNECDQSLVLRIGTIVSDNRDKVLKMKPTRIQKRILCHDFKGIEMCDKYLMLDDFVKETVNVIKNKHIGIYEYNLKEIKMIDLMRLTNELS